MRILLICTCGAKTEIQPNDVIRCGRCGAVPEILWNGDVHVLGKGEYMAGKEIHVKMIQKTLGDKEP